MARASLCLPGEQFESFRKEWQEVVSPAFASTLVVFVDLESATLWNDIRLRAGESQVDVSQDWLDDLRRALIDQTQQPEVGPVLHVDAQSPASDVEILAAVQALQG